MKARLPMATLVLIGVNLVLGAFSIRSDEWLQMLGFTPAQAKISTVISSLFVHAHPAHLAWNMVFLWLFGWHVEEGLGIRRFLFLYLGSGVVSVLCHWGFGVGFQPALDHQALVGASGAISGLVGYFALRFYRVRVRLFWWRVSRWGFLMPVWVAVLLWVGLQVVGAVLSTGSDQPISVGYWAHLGGFVCGLLVALWWGAGASGERDYLLHEAENLLRQAYPGVALQWLEPLTKGLNPDVEALRLSAEAWEHLGDRKIAADYYARALKTSLQQNPPQYEHALLYTRRLLLLHALPQADPQSLERLANWCLRCNDHLSAAQLLEALTYGFPDLPNRPSLLLRLADLMRQLSEPEASDKLLRSLIESYPDTPEADTARWWLYRS